MTEPTAHYLVYPDGRVKMLVDPTKPLFREGPNPPLEVTRPLPSTLNKIVDPIRGFVYRRGFRPKYGAILYSPSRALIYGFKDALNKKV